MALLATVAAVLAATAPAPAVVRGPVATQVTAHGATVAWRLGETADQTLRVGRRTFRVGTPRDAVVRLTGLVPGRRYPYAIQAGDRIVARGSLRAAPPPTGRFRAAVFGDHGTGGADQRAVVRRAASWRPDQRVTPGDQVYPLTLDLLLEPNFFQPLRPLLRRAALVPALGNHEQVLSGGRTFLGALELRGAERWYLERYGSAALLVLDSNTSLAPGTVQGRFLARAAAAAEHSCFRIAVLHHPPYAPSSDTLAAGLRRNLLPVLRRHGFQLLLLGHVHAYERTVPIDGMTHVAVGTGGAEIGHARWTTAPLAASSYGRFGALRLDVGPRVATGAFVTVDGTVRDRFSLRCRP
jgi:hypothetical protein